MLWWILNPYYEDGSEPILRDVFTGWSEGQGIFSYLAEIATLPWSEDENVDNSVLDISYFGNHSGGKFCAPLVKFVLNEDGEVPATARETIAKIIVSKYLPNWQRLWQTNIVSYSPINNYDMTEQRDLVAAGTGNEKEDSSLSRSAIDAVADGNDSTVEHGRTNTTTGSRYGLNTVEPVKPSDKEYMEEGGTTATEEDKVSSRVSDSTDTGSKSTDKVDAKTESETIHRIGNIGVTTNQKLIQDERDLWRWNYFDSIFKDLDNELALSFHDCCRV